MAIHCKSISRCLDFSALMYKTVLCFNSYDRLAKVITRVLNQRPADAVDIAQYLTDEQRNSFEHKVDTLIDKPDKSTETKLAVIQKSLYIVCYIFLFGVFELLI
jgi:hypothetical protein